MWQDKYIGIPFKANGRDENGLDCWGLVRLIYDREYNIQLPSFSAEYVIEDDNRIKDLIAQYREGWEEINTPEPGCGVLFRILGDITHMAVMVDQDMFIHVRPGSNTVTDSISATRWKTRIVGFFKYRENGGVVLNAIPSPLNTKRVTVVIPEGINLEQLYEKVNTENNVDPDLTKSVTIMVNGVPIPRVAWSSTILRSTDTVEYRAVPGKEVVKMALLVAVAYFAPYIAVELMGTAALTPAAAQAAAAAAAAGAAAPAITMASLSFAGTLAAVGVTIAGSYLINAIAPVRQPSSEDPGTADPQNLLTGGANPYNPYGAVPVVLGRIRCNAALGAKTYATFPNERENFLNMLLIWGYGPLTISGYRIGDTSWDNFQFNSALSNNGRMTLDRKTPITATQQTQFDEIYGNDVEQLYSGIEMLGPEPSLTGGFTSGIVSGIINGGTIIFDPNTGVLDPDPDQPEILPPPIDDETGELNFGWHRNEEGDSNTYYYNGEATPNTGYPDLGGAVPVEVRTIGESGNGISDGLSGSPKTTTPVTDVLGDGSCPDPDTPIALSYTDSVRAGDLKPGDYIFTVHEDTGAYGIFPIVRADLLKQTKVKITFKSGKTTTVSTSHKYMLADGTWNTVDNLNIGTEVKGMRLNEVIESIEPLGLGPVVRFEVRDAHTYIADGMVSHNKQVYDGDITGGTPIGGGYTSGWAGDYFYGGNSGGTPGEEPEYPGP